MHIAIHPRLCTVHLIRGVKAPLEPTELSAVLDESLRGRVVERVRALLPDRILRIDFIGGRGLVAELMGVSSNLALVDENGIVMRLAREPRGETRDLAVGRRYLPPPAAPAWIARDLSELGEASFRDLLGVSQATPAARLTEALPGFGFHLAQEILKRRSRGEDPWEAFRDLRERLDSGQVSPVLYSPGPPGELAESEDLTSRNLFAFIFPLTDVGLTTTPFATVNEAEESATHCLLKRLEHSRLSSSMSALLAKEARRASHLAETLSAELEQAERSVAQHRRYGELLLAGLATARPEGSMVRVMDHYDPTGGSIDVPIDASIGLAENAQRYFKSARRGQRARDLIPARLEAIRSRSAALERAASDLAGARDLLSLTELERRWQSTGLLKAFRRKQRPDVGASMHYVEVREFTTSEGFTVLVGKSAAENDHLTFSVAAPHDLWLHAAGWPGAHVIVRNPKRLGSMPEKTIQQAAAIAAHFSRGKAERAVDVHFAWRRHVRKGRGMAPGMVILKKHRTVRVSPALP